MNTRNQENKSNDSFHSKPFLRNLTSEWENYCLIWIFKNEFSSLPGLTCYHWTARLTAATQASLTLSQWAWKTSSSVQKEWIQNSVFHSSWACILPLHCQNDSSNPPKPAFNYLGQWAWQTSSSLQQKVIHQCLLTPQGGSENHGTSRTYPDHTKLNWVAWEASPLQSC